MIKSVLIANRGEIACRLIRLAQSLGIRTVSVFSDVDRLSLAVEMADEAYCIGPSPATQSYLNVEKIINVARKARVEAIHPGYGFLSESDFLAQACEKEGLIFIGPPLKALKTMGSKKEAKKVAQDLGIPVIPGFEGDQTRLYQEADPIGYPLMIKATLGGGGKGIRRVNTKNDFQNALEACQREALASFGSAEVLLEKYIPLPRHIEVQLFGDSHGHLVHLFERDCSLQRHHQKVIEEAPSCLPLSLKEKLYEAALKIGKAIDYVGAGTVEFLVDQDENFYFLEMNTRLQVEHPVTEEITNLDLVSWQFRIASGEPLPLFQEDIQAKGHSLEIRLCAEDPRQDFKPMTGKIWIHPPPPDTRLETGLHEKDTITSTYDALLAKLIIHGETREDVLKKADLALGKWAILGVTTNNGFLRNLINSKGVQENHIDIDYIDRHLKDLAPPRNIPDEIFYAASFLSLHSETISSPWKVPHGWRLEGYAPQSFSWTCDRSIKDIKLTYSPQGWISETPEFLTIDCHKNALSLNGAFLPFWKRQKDISLFYQGETYILTPHTPFFDEAASQSHPTSHIQAPMTGRVSILFVKEGETIKEGHPLLVLEAMKMEHMIIAPQKGKIKHLFYAPGDVVEEGVTLVEMEENGEEEEAHDLTQAS